MHSLKQLYLKVVRVNNWPSKRDLLFLRKAIYLLEHYTRTSHMCQTAVKLGGSEVAGVETLDKVSPSQ